MSKILGVDVSHYQTIKDWGKLSKAVDFIILKSTEGLSYVDATFQDKRNNARQKEMLVGAYHFASGIDGKKEADF